MTDPTGTPSTERGSMSEATGHALRADRARIIAAEHAARRRRGSFAGRVERAWRWVRNRQSGPLPRLRRMASVLRLTVRQRGLWRALPEAILNALLAPVRLPGPPPPPKPPRDWAPERAAAAGRVAAFATRTLRSRPRVAVIADAAGLEAYRGDWDTVAIRPEDWAMVLETAPDLLVVDAARAGNGSAWAYRVAWTAHPDFFLLRDLSALVGWCAGRAIPTVFRARESAAAWPDWADAASLFDIVLVPDAESLAAYQALPDRRGQVLQLPADATARDGDGTALLRAIRAAA